MNKEELLKDILENPDKYYTNRQLDYLSTKIKKKKERGNMRSFVKKKIMYDTDREYIFTDGSCTNNGQKNSKAAYAVFYGKNDIRNIARRLKPKIGERVSNNKAELKAILECLKTLSPEGKYYIVSDSEYSINCVTKWSKGWEVNGWKTTKGKDVLNKDLIKDIIEMLKILNVKFIHVESHKNKPNDKSSMEYKLWYGNFMVDKMAFRLTS